MSHEFAFKTFGMDKTNMTVSIGTLGTVFSIHNLLNGADETLSFKLDRNQVEVLVAALIPITTGDVKGN